MRVSVCVPECGYVCLCCLTLICFYVCIPGCTAVHVRCSVWSCASLCKFVQHSVYVCVSVWCTYVCAHLPLCFAYGVNMHPFVWFRQPLATVTTHKAVSILPEAYCTNICVFYTSTSREIMACNPSDYISVGKAMTLTFSKIELKLSSLWKREICSLIVCDSRDLVIFSWPVSMQHKDVIKKPR